MSTSHMKKKLLIYFLLSFISGLSYAQNSTILPMKDALNLLTGRIGLIEKLGYKVNGLTLLTDWGGLKLRGDDLFVNHPDSVYVEAFAIVDKRDYTANDEGLSVWKLANHFDKLSRDSLIANKSSTRTITKNRKIIDSWKIGFIPNKDGDSFQRYFRPLLQVAISMCA
jgi:hypothetical protein